MPKTITLEWVENRFLPDLLPKPFVLEADKEWYPAGTYHLEMFMISNPWWKHMNYTRWIDWKPDYKNMIPSKKVAERVWIPTEVTNQSLS